MDLVEALILGIIQGIFEWLPVSSEGINSIYLTTRGYAISEAIPLAIWLHAGTLLAATIYFRKDVIAILRNIPSCIKRNKSTDVQRTTTFLIISTAFTGIIGLPLVLYSLDNLKFSGITATALIGILLILTGIIQKKASQKKDGEKKITITDSILMGILQGLSALPGLSRSGLTTSGMLLRRYDAKTALKLSFLMSIPAVLAAEVGLVLMEKIALDMNSLIAIMTSFIFGYITIGALIDIAQKIRFWKFCIFLGALCIFPYLSKEIYIFIFS